MPGGPKAIQQAGSYAAAFEITPLTRRPFRLRIESSHGDAVVSESIRARGQVVFDDLPINEQQGSTYSGGAPDYYDQDIWKLCRDSFAGFEGANQPFPDEHQGDCGPCVEQPALPNPITCRGDGLLGGPEFCPGFNAKCYGITIIDICLVHNKNLIAPSYTGHSEMRDCAPIARSSGGQGLEIGAGIGPKGKIIGGQLEIENLIPVSVEYIQRKAHCCVFTASPQVKLWYFSKCIG